MNSSKSPYTLVVVDMQPLFRASLRADVQQAVTREVAAAVELGFPVIVLECYPQVNGRTTAPLLAALADYDSLKQIVLEKKSSSGGRQVFEACRLFDWPEDFRVCGVNTTDCVFETISDLAIYLRQATFTLVQAACADEFHTSEESVWQRFAEKSRQRFQYTLC